MKLIKVLKKIVFYIIITYLALCLLVVLIELTDGIVHPKHKSEVTNRKPNVEVTKKK